MPSPFPHRVSLAPPVLALHADVRSLAEPIADVLAAVMHAELVRHPVVSMIAPDDRRVADERGELLCFGHARFGELLDAAFLDDRRDEVIWLELAFDVGGKAHRAKLRVVTAEERTDEEMNAIGEPTLSGLLATCVGQWLASRRLPPAIGAWPHFGATELFAAAAHVAQFRAEALRDPSAATLPPGFGGPLEVAATRAAWKGFGRGDAHRASVRRVLAIAPDDADALRSEALYRIGEGVAPHVAMGPVIAIAPQWGSPRLAMHGAGLPEAEALRHASTAALLSPGDPHALHALALALWRAGRFEEAVRAADRATLADPSFVQARVTALRALRDTHRSGEAYLVARGRAEEVDALDETALDPRAMASLALARAETAFDVGRLDEAIEIAETALEDVADGTSFRRQREELVRWRTEPEMLASSFARDGHFRGDPGRVLDGFARARPRFSLDVAMIVRALVTLGHEDVALLACAEHVGGGVALGPHARVARALARMIAGDVAGATEDVTIVALRYPQSKHSAESHRVLRVGSTHGAAPFERVVGRWLELGARRVARLVARDAADFVPGLETSATVLDALGPRASTTFDGAWLEPLVDALGSRSLVAIEAFFHQYKRPALDHADRLAGDWHMLIAPSRRDEQTWLEQVVYVLAQSLGRYLVATTEAPTPLAGGYRQVACDALSLIARFGRGEWKSEWIAPLLGVIEHASTGVDPWLFDAWTLRVERAFALEHETGAHLGVATCDAPRVKRSLRGDERIAFEHGFALSLLAEGHAEQATELFERTVRAVGSGTPALRWSDAARARSGDVIDVSWTAALAHATHPAGWGHLARVALAAGRGDVAYEALVRAMPVAGDDWRTRVREEVRERWADVVRDVPIAPMDAQTEGVARLARGDVDGAMRCLRWANACDPRNAATGEALATARARLRDVPAAIETLAMVDRTDAPKRAAALLVREGAEREAANVRAYATLVSSAAVERIAIPAAGTDESTDVSAAARRALWIGDREGVIAACAGKNDWAHRRIALAATELRCEPDDKVPVRRAALVAAEDTLRASVGATDLDASIARVHALRIREGYCFPIDPPPPIGEILGRDAFEAQWRARANAGHDPDRPTVPLASDEPPSTLSGSASGAASSPPTAQQARPTMLLVDPSPASSSPPSQSDASSPAQSPSQPSPTTPASSSSSSSLSSTTPASSPPMPAAIPSSIVTQQMAAFAQTAEVPIGERATDPWQASSDDDSRSSVDATSEEPCPRLSDLVDAFVALETDDPLDALATLGLDLVSLGRACERWGERVAADPHLRAHLVETWRDARAEKKGRSS